MDETFFLIYTTEEGGFFKTSTTPPGAIRRITEEEFEEIRRTGWYRWQDWNHGILYEEQPVFIGLAQIIDHHDFVIGGKRGGEIERSDAVGTEEMHDL